MDFGLPDVTETVAAALAEDLGVPREAFMPGVWADHGVLARDVTSSAIVPEGAEFAGVVVARVDAVVCGLPVLAAVYERLCDAAGLDEPVEVFPLVAEGSAVAAGTAVAEVSGSARAVLAGERTALDFVMVLSGIATTARAWRDAASPVAVVDTRKTVPGLRALSKYASRVGGIENHRSGLWDMVLVKDNHLRHVLITDAVARANDLHPELRVQVEADSAGQAFEAIEAGADMVLLDNMDDATLADAVRQCRAVAERRGRPVVLEASGNVTIERLASLRATGVDRVSTSAITLARPLDFALDER